MSAISQGRSIPVLPGRRAELFIGGALLLFAVLVLHSLNPATSNLFPPCPLLWLTGYYCPGCGSLRALHHLFHGDVPSAFAFNPLAVLALPFLFYGAASRATFLMRGRYLPRVFLPPWTIWALASLVILFGILRNLPVYPFDMLAPGAMR